MRSFGSRAIRTEIEREFGSGARGGLVPCICKTPGWNSECRHMDRGSRLNGTDQHMQIVPLREESPFSSQITHAVFLIRSVTILRREFWYAASIATGRCNH